MDSLSNDVFFSISAIEFEKVYMVMDKRIALGYSGRDLSFLLGYRPLYVRDVEDPRHMLRYTPKDTNYLQLIFDCKLEEIMLPKTVESVYRIRVDTLIREGDNPIYKISRKLNNNTVVSYRTINLNEDTNGSLLKATVKSELVLDYIRDLFEGNYFNEPKTALEVFNKCKKKLGESVQPCDLACAIAFYTAKRKSPKLNQVKNKSSRTVYSKG